MEIDQTFVEDDPDRRLAVAEGNDPYPVTESGVVIRGQPARTDIASREIAGARSDVIDVAHAVPAAPDRCDGMLFIAHDQSEAAAEEVDASGGVEQPAAAQLANLFADFDRELVIEIAELHVPRLGRTEQLRPLGDSGSEQVFIKRITTELKRGDGTAKETAR